MDRKSRSAKDSATAKTIKKASPVGDDEEPPVQKKTNNSKLSEEKNSTKSGDLLKKLSRKESLAIDHRDKAGNETKRIELKKAESVGTEKDSEKPSLSFKEQSQNRHYLDQNKLCQREEK